MQLPDELQAMCYEAASGVPWWSWRHTVCWQWHAGRRLCYDNHLPTEHTISHVHTMEMWVVGNIALLHTPPCPQCTRLQNAARMSPEIREHSVECISAQNVVISCSQLSQH